MSASTDPRPTRERRRGQIIPIFALSLLVFVGMTAIVVDISWYWANNLRIQRAADAAALAGVVHLPGDVPLAVSVARAEAAKNGYTDGVGGVTVTPYQDPTNPRRLKVEITAPVRTFFMRVFGIDSLPAKRAAKAEFVLPVPMGSPENYYGVFGTLRTPNGGTTVTTPGTTAFKAPTSTVAPNEWTNPSNAFAADDVYATATADNDDQGYGGFGFSIPAGSIIDG
ncbi:MAG TPA: pilus assembly protein TadG-related protein, partial [Candidatus Binatia bacterium]|nr:pilus assembly protein TadG-related protein [Candidatus Binatia bacterium]